MRLMRLALSRDMSELGVASLWTQLRGSALQSPGRNVTYVLSCNWKILAEIDSSTLISLLMFLS